MATYTFKELNDKQAIKESLKFEKKKDQYSRYYFDTGQYIIHQVRKGLFRKKLDIYLCHSESEMKLTVLHNNLRVTVTTSGAQTFDPTLMKGRRELDTLCTLLRRQLGENRRHLVRAIYKNIENLQWTDRDEEHWEDIVTAYLIR